MLNFYDPKISLIESYIPLFTIATNGQLALLSWPRTSFTNAGVILRSLKMTSFLLFEPRAQ